MKHAFRVSVVLWSIAYRTICHWWKGLAAVLRTEWMNRLAIRECRSTYSNMAIKPESAKDSSEGAHARRTRRRLSGTIRTGMARWQRMFSGRIPERGCLGPYRLLREFNGHSSYAYIAAGALHGLNALYNLWSIPLNCGKDVRWVLHPFLPVALCSDCPPQGNLCMKGNAKLCVHGRYTTGAYIGFHNCCFY